VDDDLLSTRRRTLLGREGRREGGREERMGEYMIISPSAKEALPLHT